MASIEGDFKLERRNNGWIIAGYEGSEAHLSIPSHIDGDPVVLISKEAFQDNACLVSVEIPETVTFIGNFAFGSCALLERVSVLARIGTLNLGTFWRCPALQDVHLPDSLTKIGDGAFRDCATLKSLDVPASVVEIGDSAFRDCPSLATIVLGSGVTTIQRSAFRDCKALAHVAVTSSLSYIGPRAFQGCTSLDSIKIAGSNLEATLTAFMNHNMTYLVADYAIQEKIFTPAEGRRLFNSDKAADRLLAARVLASYPDQLERFYAKQSLAQTLAEGGCTDELRAIAQVPGFFDDGIVRACIDAANDAGHAESAAFLLDLLSEDAGGADANRFEAMKL